MPYRKSQIIQELCNVYPDWSRVRTDEQSVGHQFLNPIGVELEYAEKEIIKMRDNQFLTSANLDEIDLVYKIQMDTDFSFDEDTNDPLQSYSIAPTISGYQNESWYSVTEAEEKDIESFWYTSIPNRASLTTITSGVNHSLHTMDANDTPVTGLWNHHLTGGGRMWLEATGGVEYITTEQDRLYRGRVILAGKTRKGTEEEETIVFPWDMKQPTKKEWEYIDGIHCFDIEDDVEISLRSGDFNSGPYLDPWNLRYSPYRKKIDTFWDIGHNGSIPTLDRIEYQTDEWEQLVLGFSTKGVQESWELLDESSTTVSGVDMTIQPYTDNIWVADSSNNLYCYALYDTVPSNLDELKDTSIGSHVQIETDFTSLVLGEDIYFVPWHARPLKQVIKYRLWYQEPDGTKYGLLDGSAVSYTSDFWVKIAQSTDMERTIGNYITITTTQRGDYLVVLEVVYVDEEEHQFRKIFSTKYKEPLVTIDLSSIVPGAIDGIDFDSDQRMWVKSGNDYYQIQLHKDLVLIDYDNKVLYFHENYSSVEIITDG